MKFAGYVAWILLCRYCAFGEKITTIPCKGIEFILEKYLFDAPCT